MNIFTNAFKFKTEFLEEINNGTVSRKYLSSLNPATPPVRSTVSGIFTTALAMYCSGFVEVLSTAEGNIVTISKGQISKRNYYTQLGKSNFFYFVKDKDGEILDMKDKIHWSMYTPFIIELYNKYTDFHDAVDALKADFFGGGKKFFSNCKQLYIYNDMMYYSKDLYPNECQQVIFEVPTKKETLKKATKKKKEKCDIKELKDYTLPWNRKLSKEETQRIPKLKLGVEAIVSDFAIKTAEIIKGEYDSLEPVKNILWYGGAGTGKSFGTLVLAQLLGLPHYSFDFSKGVDEVMITAGADVSEGTINYNDSQIVMAAKNGGVVEFREFYNARPEVISFLNGFLQEGELRLANGKVIPRHPNCIVVATSNINYAGCQEIDFSTDDRFTLQFNVFPMPDDALIDLIEKSSGNNDRALLAKLLKAFKDISYDLEKNEYDEGICSMRKLISWAKCCKPIYDMSVIEAAEITILSGISKDMNKRQEIKDEYLSHIFPEYEV